MAQTPNQLVQKQAKPIDIRKSHVIRKGGRGQVPVGCPVFIIYVASRSEPCERYA